MPKGIYKRTEKHRLINSIGHKGQKAWNKGKSWSLEIKLKMSKAKDRGKTKQRYRLMKSEGWNKWRESVFKRDNYTCQKCGQVGNKLEPHHIKPKALYPKLIFIVSNGITLCKKCHRKTDSFGKRFDLKQQRKS